MTNISELTSQEMPTILLVDDIPANLELLMSHLEKLYVTPIAKDGARALERARLIQPDLILLDIQMPIMDGYETCHQLKQFEETKDIPVIFMSALSQPIDKVRGFQLGAVDYITKPIESTELHARISTHLTLSRMRKELQEKNKQLEENALRQKRVESILRHDLKSPLQAILCIPDLLRLDDACSDSQKELLSLLDQSAHNILDMVNSSLTLYKMEHGTYSVTFKKIDVISSIQKIIDTSKTHSKKISIKINAFNSDETLLSSAYIGGEEALLYSLFSNLIKNAIEASHTNDTIVISVIEGENIVITITNSGAVPVDVRSTFFEEFSTSGKEFGTGLGTYSAKLITEALKGSISLDSSVDEQTTICITFPAFIE